MIAYLTGIVTEKELDHLVIEVKGVGYAVYATSDDLNGCELGVDKKLFIYEHIREQAHDLFGFIEIGTRQLFEQLLAVNGVGPKMALAVLSIGSVDSVKQAIAEGNVKYLQVAQGVGRRVAERIVVDLKDKIGQPSYDSATGFLSGHAAISDDATEALVELGFTPSDAAKALRGVNPELKTEERVKQALKGSY